VLADVPSSPHEGHHGLAPGFHSTIAPLLRTERRKARSATIPRPRCRARTPQRERTPSHNTHHRVVRPAAPQRWAACRVTPPCRPPGAAGAAWTCRGPLRPWLRVGLNVDTKRSARERRYICRKSACGGEQFTDAPHRYCECCDGSPLESAAGSAAGFPRGQQHS
jgi:hypothetical protein